MKPQQELELESLKDRAWHWELFLLENCKWTFA